MKEQCFLVREDMRGRGVLSRVKAEVSRGGGRRWWMQEDGSQMSWKNDLETSGMARVEISSKKCVWVGNFTCEEKNYAYRSFCVDSIGSVDWLIYLVIYLLNNKAPKGFEQVAKLNTRIKTVEKYSQFSDRLRRCNACLRDYWWLTCCRLCVDR